MQSIENVHAGTNREGCSVNIKQIRLQVTDLMFYAKSKIFL